MLKWNFSSLLQPKEICCSHQKQNPNILMGKCLSGPFFKGLKKYNLKTRDSISYIFTAFFRKQANKNRKAIYFSVPL
jgi:hypothetical protein